MKWEGFLSLASLDVSSIVQAPFADGSLTPVPNIIIYLGNKYNENTLF